MELSARDDYISIHALLAESDRILSTSRAFSVISIHALLAESDHSRRDHADRRPDFYPRSPCGERRASLSAVDTELLISIHALLAESDTLSAVACCAPLYFYPRSPCGERLSALAPEENPTQFLSTLSLRRATHYDNYNLHCTEISIHALLAESDRQAFFYTAQHIYFYPRSPCGERPIKA